MTNKDEALKLALEALDSCWKVGLTENNWRLVETSITAIREALAEQPAQQPITGLDVYLDPSDGLKPKLYSPKPAQQQEPMAKDAEEWGGRLNQASWAAIEAWDAELMGPMSGAVFNNIKGVVRAAILEYVKGYTFSPASPSQGDIKPWVGLTLQEKDYLLGASLHTQDAIDKTDALLREKNHG